MTETLGVLHHINNCEPLGGSGDPAAIYEKTTKGREGRGE